MKILSDELRFRIKKKDIFVNWREEGEEVLINYCNKDAERGMIILDPISSKVWKELIKGKKIKTVERNIQKRFKLPPHLVRKNLEKLIKFFLHRKLIEVLK